MTVPENVPRQSTAATSVSSSEAQLLDYLPTGHCMHMLVPHLLKMLDITAFIEIPSGKQITYREMLHNAVKLAAWLVENTNRSALDANTNFVQLFGDNSIAAFTAMYATWLAGAGVATASPTWTRERFSTYCSRVEATTLVVDAGILASMDPANVDAADQLASLQHIILVNDDDNQVSSPFKQKTVRYADILRIRSFEDALQYLLIRRNSIFDVEKYGDYSQVIDLLAPSSGTTGVPKTIVKNHQCLTSRHTLWGRAEAANPGDFPDIADHPYTLFFASLSSAGFVITEHLGSYTAVRSKRPTGLLLPLLQFDPYLVAETIERYRVSHVHPMVPQMLRVFFDANIKARYDLSSIERCSTGGWPLKPNLQRRVIAMQNWKSDVLGQGYGTTECSGLLSSSSLSEQEQAEKIGSIGRPMPQFTSYEYKLVDLANNEIVITTPNTRGELLIRELPDPEIRPLFKGYYKNKAKTDEVLTADGWYRTGDVIYFDEDNVWWHVERIAELLWLDDKMWKAPAELEEALLIACERYVVDVALVAVTHKPPSNKVDGGGRQLLDKLVVFVEPRKNVATPLPEKSLRELVCCEFNEHVKDPRLFLSPDRVHLCCRLPRNNSKIMRSYLRDLLDKPDELKQCLDKLAKITGAC